MRIGLTRVVLPKGQVQSVEYDNNNRLIASTNKLGEKTTYEYYPSGKRRKIVFSDNTFEEYTYENGLLTRIRNRQGVVTKLSYDNNENIISETNAAGDTIRYEYDKLDMLVKIITPEGGERRFSYDKVGNMTKIIDELGNVTSYEYTSNGKLSKVIDAKGNETSYKYDTVGNLIEVKRIGEFDEITSYEYDLNGNVTKVTDPLMNSDVYTYDGMGRVISKLDRDENFTNISYNSIGQVEKITYSDDNEVKMSYDELGFLKEIEDLNGKIEIETDILGHVLTTTDYSGNRVLYEYENNKRKSMIYPDGKKLDYQYNDNGLLSSICLNNSRLVSYTYDKMARPLTKLMSNGQESDYTYNSIGRLSSVTHKLGDKIESLSYRYDLSGNKTEVVKHRLNETDNGTFTYGYDALNQLTSVSKDNNLLREYAYDSFGNRASKKSYKDTIEESIYTYNKNNQLIKEVMPSVTKIYDYDKRGNLTTITSNDVVTDRYEYGINNQLISSSIVKNNDRVTSSYSYNGLGQRIGEVINTPEDSEKKISYVLDITKQYNNMLTESKGERIANYYYDNGAIALDIEDITSYYMQDDLGSVLGLTDKDCNIIESYDYDEFGNELEPVSNPIQSLTYTGYRKELATNSLYAQARQYNPRVGRFTSEDIVSGSMLSPLTFNKYKYCMNSPLVYVDVDGRNECPLGWINDETPSEVVGIGGFMLSTISSVSDVLTQILSKVEQLFKAFSGIGSHANAFKGFKSIKIFSKIAKMSRYIDVFIVGYDVLTGIIDNKEANVDDINKYVEDALIDVCIDVFPYAVQMVSVYALAGSFAGPIGALVGVCVGFFSFVFLDLIKYGEDKKTGRAFIKEGVYESAPIIGRAAHINASHYQLGKTLTYGWH